jgi:hypothetical protein
MATRTRLASALLLLALPSVAAAQTITVATGRAPATDIAAAAEKSDRATVGALLAQRADVNAA